MCLITDCGLWTQTLFALAYHWYAEPMWHYKDWGFFGSEVDLALFCGSTDGCPVILYVTRVMDGPSRQACARTPPPPRHPPREEMNNGGKEQQLRRGQLLTHTHTHNLRLGVVLSAPLNPGVFSAIYIYILIYIIVVVIYVTCWVCKHSSRLYIAWTE